MVYRVQGLDVWWGLLIYGAIAIGETYTIPLET